MTIDQPERTVDTAASTAEPPDEARPTSRLTVARSHAAVVAGSVVAVVLALLAILVLLPAALAAQAAAAI
jgi:hypothetical protein